MTNNIVLFNGCYVVLNDGQVRGPLFANEEWKGRAVPEVRFRLTINPGCSDDLALGWRSDGIYNGRHEHLNVARVYSKEEALETFAAIRSEHLHRSALLATIASLSARRSAPLFLNQAEQDYIIGWLRHAMQRRDDLNHPAEAEPAPVIERSFLETDAVFRTWRKQGGPNLEPIEQTVRSAFHAGYNAALRNESGLGIRPFENAEGGQSDSISSILQFKVGFVGEDLNRLNPLIRKFFEVFGEANGAKFKGIEFLPNGKAVVEFDDEITDYHLALNGWPGMSWPDLVDVFEPAKADLPPIPSAEELARELHATLIGNAAKVDYDQRSDEVKARLIKTAVAMIERLRGPQPNPIDGAAKTVKNPMDDLI